MRNTCAYQQSYNISSATLCKDVPVAVFPFAALTALLRELDADPAVRRKNGHHGHHAGGMWRNLTTADYDDDTLRRLCAVYAADAALLRHLGHRGLCTELS